jgi:hypothetical protein
VCISLSCAPTSLCVGLPFFWLPTDLSLCVPLLWPPPRNLFDYDQVVNTQRDRVYAERRRALLSTDLTPLMLEYAEKTCDDILEVRWVLCVDTVVAIMGVC